MSKSDVVPFNDLSRIHIPLLEQFGASLKRLVESSSLVLGDEVAAFEKELAIAEGCKFAIGVNNGTSAIELTLRAFDIGEGDEVITTAFTFVATCFSILQAGATPVLVDIDPLSGLIDPACIEQAITHKTKAIVFVTLHGRVESLDKVRDICETHGLRFIIDAAQSHLGTLKGIPQTNFSDAATLSFYPGKNLGALGEGGAILTNSPEIKEKLMLMRDWGAREKYNHTVWGGNFRLEPLQASFLRIKLRELANWTQDRKRIAEIYRDRLNSDLLMKPISEDGSHVFHIFSIVVNNRTEFCHKMTQNQIGFGFHYPRAIHQQSAYRERVKKPFGLSNSEYLANTTLSLPIFPGQSDFEIEMVIDIANSGLRN